MARSTRQPVTKIKGTVGAEKANRIFRRTNKVRVNLDLEPLLPDEIVNPRDVIEKKKISKDVRETRK